MPTEYKELLEDPLLSWLCSTSGTGLWLERRSSTFPRFDRVVLQGPCTLRSQIHGFCSIGTICNLQCLASQLVHLWALLKIHILVNNEWSIIFKNSYHKKPASFRLLGWKCLASWYLVYQEGRPKDHRIRVFWFEELAWPQAYFRFSKLCLWFWEIRSGSSWSTMIFLHLGCQWLVLMNLGWTVGGTDPLMITTRSW